MEHSFKNYYSEQRIEKNGDKSALFGLDGAVRSFIIEEIMINDAFYAQVIEDLKLTNQINIGNNVVEYILTKIEAEITLKSIGEMFSIVAFLYANMDHITQKLAALLPRASISDILGEIFNTIQDYKQSKGLTGITSKLNYNYKIENNLLIITSKEEITYTEQHLIKAINEINEKESYDIICKLRMFYNSSEGEAFEVIPKWNENKIEKCEISKL